ncbi:MAG TPA: 3-phosphoglycerate dehydrogenase family protein [Prolixibacteraceae bacterium]|nr:3-phosphoglycerate dehydrogenase family protein [Prolixibacteraceae bacterium]HRV89195.1 3-phosphoglycerate dehydrogenase family protein [Prolixibacteraceae bacterium]
MYKVLTLDKIDPQGLGHFPHEKYETGNSFTSPDAIILRSFNMHSMELPESVKAVARAGAGVNNIPIDRCTEQGIVVFNTPGANANGVKELVLAGLLLASRDISGGIAWAKGLVEEGDQVPALVEKGKKNYAGTEILGKSLAVIGLGAVGVLVANAAQMLGMNVTGYDPYISVAQAQKLSDKIQLARTLESAIASADFVTLNIPLTPDTKGYINKEIIKGMKNGVRVLNFARGELVNNADMAEALEYGKVFRYVTDFPNEETLRMKNAICIPHLGASTEESETNCAIMAVDQLREYFERGNIINSVNFPNVEMDRTGGTRIVVANRNIPNMVNQIASVLSREGVNILNMLNKNKKDIAYNIIDIDKTDLRPGIEEDLRTIEGVFMARILG